MKKALFLTVLLSLLFLTSSFVTHKFYLSVYQIEHNTTKKRVEVTARIFIDDIEKAMKDKYKKDFYLTTSDETKDAKEYLHNYLNSQFKLELNGEPQQLEFIKETVEDNQLICYFKVNYSKKITTFGLLNSILLNSFSNQQNLVHVNMNGEKESFLLTKSNKTIFKDYN